MHLELAALEKLECYKIITGLVIPRPIAWVSTVNAQGVNNCAPYSFFNAFSEDPPLCMVSFAPRKDGKVKHSLKNILDTGEFVVNLGDEATANALHISADEIPEDESEFEKTGLTPAPCLRVRHPRIAEAPVALECTLFEKLETPSRHIFIGRVLWMHARDDLIDLERYRVRLQNYYPVARFGASFYTRTRDRFAIGADAHPEHSTAIDEI